MSDEARRKGSRKGDEPLSEEAITRRRFVTGAALGAAVIWSSPFPFVDKAIGQLLPVDDALGATGPTGPTGPGPSPTQPSTARIHLRRRVQVNRRGRFPVRIECVGSQPLDGTLIVQVRLRAKRRRGAARPRVRQIVIARANFQIPAGQTRRVHFHLTRRGRELLRRRGILAAKVIVEWPGNVRVRPVRLLAPPD